MGRYFSSELPCQDQFKESINDFNWKCKYFFTIILNLEKMKLFHFGQVLLFWGLSLVLVF